MRDEGYSSIPEHAQTRGNPHDAKEFSIFSVLKAHPIDAREREEGTEARCDLPPPGGPNISRFAPLSSQPSPAHNAETWALEIIGTASKSKFSSVLPASSFASVR
jgi:hypothetical protein